MLPLITLHFYLHRSNSADRSQGCTRFLRFSRFSPEVICTYLDERKPLSGAYYTLCLVFKPLPLHCLRNHLTMEIMLKGVQVSLWGPKFLWLHQKKANSDEQNYSHTHDFSAHTYTKILFRGSREYYTLRCNPLHSLLHESLEKFSERAMRSDNKMC